MVQEISASVSAAFRNYLYVRSCALDHSAAVSYSYYYRFAEHYSVRVGETSSRWD
jgi:hypothetical protein